eukprot:5616466-Prymnesium_polylepis.2
MSGLSDSRCQMPMSSHVHAWAAPNNRAADNISSERFLPWSMPVFHVGSIADQHPAAEPAQTRPRSLLVDLSAGLQTHQFGP